MSITKAERIAIVTFAIVLALCAAAFVVITLWAFKVGLLPPAAHCDNCTAGP